MSFSLDSIVQNETATLQLAHPETGALLGVSITLAAPHSATYKKVQFAIQNRVFQNFSRGKKSITAEKSEANNIELLIGVTVGWENLEHKGEELPCTPENARLVYTTYPWVTEQADTFLGETANFLSS